MAKIKIKDNKGRTGRPKKPLSDRGENFNIRMPRSLREAVTNALPTYGPEYTRNAFIRDAVRLKLKKDGFSSAVSS